jgi:hypothetical protein
MMAVLHGQMNIGQEWAKLEDIKIVLFGAD